MWIFSFVLSTLVSEDAISRWSCTDLAHCHQSRAAQYCLLHTPSCTVLLPLEQALWHLAHPLPHQCCCQAWQDSTFLLGWASCRLAPSEFIMDYRIIMGGKDPSNPETQPIPSCPSPTSPGLWEPPGMGTLPGQLLHSSAQ